MKKFIVTTTIQSPTLATHKFSEKSDWTLVVVGDTKTPHGEYEKLNCVYLHPDDQSELAPELSELIGWRSIQRRNLGFLYAYQQGADIVATVDDDNIPYDHWGENVLVGTQQEVDVWESQNGYFDPLSVTDTPSIWHRGYPIEHVHTKNNVTYLGKHKRNILVQADLWDGDPDIDAMCRLTQKPIVKFSDNIAPYGSIQMSPFNSQNTFLHRSVIPYYMVLPHVGRMDDIWGAYLLQKEFPDSVIYNKASVYQDRNVQDLVTNLEKEIIGYRNTLNFINDHYELESQAAAAYECYKDCFKTI